ncbi:Sec-independent protein translocase protein TatB [Sciscionella marina]|uniref:Sec-independent protein translocase protein TatB n=1 Tax=Sciscionella marina TaxID=508770 RepID=UPI00035EA226|nr:Sec-independent protein translocase protein TatB [Sciscionella marina]
MFNNLGWPEILVIIVAGLFILGPERLPATIQHAGRALRRARTYATGAREQLRNELGPEFDELREPLEHIRELRAMGPRRAITEHLLDGYDPADDAQRLDPRDDLETLDQHNSRTDNNPSAPTPRPQQPTPFDPETT